MADRPAKKVNKAKARLQRRAEAMEAQREAARAEVAALPDLRSIEAQKIADKSRARQLVEHDIKADGHCLYSAFADQLNTRCNMQLNYKDLRERTAAYMRNHPDEFAPFLQDKSGESRSLEAYTTEIQETARWGGEMEISAVARSFSVSVRVIRAEGGDLAYEAQHGTELVLARYEHMYSLGAHFNSMRPAGENARVA